MVLQFQEASCGDAASVDEHPPSVRKFDQCGVALPDIEKRHSGCDGGEGEKSPRIITDLQRDDRQPSPPPKIQRFLRCIPENQSRRAESVDDPKATMGTEGTRNVAKGSDSVLRNNFKRA